jgi:hypothetical protein
MWRARGTKDAHNMVHVKGGKRLKSIHQITYVRRRWTKNLSHHYTCGEEKRN